jgi:hypothetical protein
MRSRSGWRLTRPAVNLWAAWLWTVGGLCSLLAFRGLTHNEYDVLPAAKQFVDPGWLPNDWYLNLPISYRYAFDLPVGLALKLWSFPAVAVAGRVVLFALFAAAAVALCRAFEVRLALCLPWLYAFQWNQSLGAGEWILRGLETKPFAYACVVLALAALARARYAAMAAWLGAALSFHLLVGVYAGLCTFGCLLLSEHRPHLSRVHRWIWPGVVTGGAGLAALLSYALKHGRLDPAIAERGAEIYVRLRVPHHVLPSTWSNPSWKSWFTVCAVGFLLVRLRKTTRYRTLAQYALGAAGLFCVGLVLSASNRITALRFYWFRFGDVMLPLLGWFALAMLWSEAMARLGERETAWARRTSVAAGALLFTTALGGTVVSFAPHLVDRPTRVLSREIRPQRFRIPDVSRSAMSRWIMANTPRTAGFLIDPREERFYVETERSPLVTFKHSPQFEADIVEWYARLRRLASDADPRGGGFGVVRQLSAAFARLTPAEVEGLARDYRIDYLLTPSTGLPFPKLHEDSALSLYYLGPTSAVPCGDGREE